MKKYILMIAATATIILSVNAQKMAVAKVHVAAKVTFAKQFPTASAKWEKENG